jgi:hypothetical protein
MPDNASSTGPTDQIIAQGRALIRAIEALDVIEPRSHWEGRIAELLQAAFECRLDEILETAPAWMVEKILEARGHELKIVYASI